MIIFWYIMGKKKIGVGFKKAEGTTYTVLFSHSRKLAHSRGGIYRWNYFARKKPGSSIIMFPDPVVQSSLRDHKDVKKNGDDATGERPAKRVRI